MDQLKSNSQARSRAFIWECMHSCMLARDGHTYAALAGPEADKIWYPQLYIYIAIDMMEQPLLFAVSNAPQQNESIVCKICRQEIWKTKIVIIPIQGAFVQYIMCNRICKHYHIYVLTWYHWKHYSQCFASVLKDQTKFGLSLYKAHEGLYHIYIIIIHIHSTYHALMNCSSVCTCVYVYI